MASNRFSATGPLEAARAWQQGLSGIARTITTRREQQQQRLGAQAFAIGLEEVLSLSAETTPANFAATIRGGMERLREFNIPPAGQLQFLKAVSEISPQAKRVEKAEAETVITRQDILKEQLEKLEERDVTEAHDFVLENPKLFGAEIVESTLKKMGLEFPEGFELTTIEAEGLSPVEIQQKIDMMVLTSPLAIKSITEESRTEAAERLGVTAPEVFREFKLTGNPNELVAYPNEEGLDIKVPRRLLENEIKDIQRTLSDPTARLLLTKDELLAKQKRIQELIIASGGKISELPVKPPPPGTGRESIWGDTE